VKYHSETTLNNEYGLKNEGQECKTGPVTGRVLVGGAGWIERLKEGAYGQCALYVCIKKTVKPDESILNRGRG
jgi:hypothetical protein